MRITSGKYRGRKILVTKQLNARPTMAMVRESIFNILNSYISIEGCKILDLYCGSGSLTFESLSHGAEHSFMIDINYNHLKFVKNTAMSLNLINSISVICCKAEKLPSAMAECDIVFIDPPYNDYKVIESILHILPVKGWIKIGSFIVIEIRKKSVIVLPESYQLICKRNYGATQLIILSYIS